MDNNNSNKSENNFFSGFILGALVGAVVVFLLGTKKGKRLLKAISEEGVGNISNILDEASKVEDFNEVSSDHKEVAPKRDLSFKVKPIDRPKVRRFFRGISRHVN